MLPKDSASSMEASPSRRHKEALSGAETSEFYGKEVLQNVSVASMIPEGGKGYLPGSLTLRGSLYSKDLKTIGYNQPEDWPGSPVCAQAGRVASAPKGLAAAFYRGGNVPRAIITFRNDFVGLIAAHKSFCVCSKGSRTSPIGC